MDQERVLAAVEEVEDREQLLAGGPGGGDQREVVEVDPEPAGGGDLGGVPGVGVGAAPEVEDGGQPLLGDQRGQAVGRLGAPVDPALVDDAEVARGTRGCGR